MADGKEDVPKKRKKSEAKVERLEFQRGFGWLLSF